MDHGVTLFLLSFECQAKQDVRKASVVILSAMNLHVRVPKIKFPKDTSFNWGFTSKKRDRERIFDENRPSEGDLQ